MSDIDVAATQFEAYFLRRVLSEVRGGSQTSLLDSGVGGKMFRELLDEALADAMAESGGVGVAEVLVEQMDGRQDTDPESVAQEISAYVRQI